MRKPAFCICENKDADQLRGNRKADQRLCFRYTDNTIHLLPKSEISSLQPSSVAVQPGLCRTWSETPKTGFLTTRLKAYVVGTCNNSLGEAIRMDTHEILFHGGYKLHVASKDKSEFWSGLPDIKIGCVCDWALSPKTLDLSPDL